MSSTFFSGHRILCYPLSPFPFSSQSPSLYFHSPVLYHVFLYFLFFCLLVFIWLSPFPSSSNLRHSPDLVDRDSSIGIATAYGLDGTGIEPLWGARFSTPVQTNTGTHPASCTTGTGSSPGVKRPGRGVDHPSKSSAEINPLTPNDLYRCRTAPLTSKRCIIYIQQIWYRLF